MSSPTTLDVACAEKWQIVTNVRACSVPGEAIRTNYGAMTTDQLLLNYGFVMPDNPHDILELPVGSLSYALEAHSLAEGGIERVDQDDAANEELVEAQMRLLQVPSVHQALTPLVPC